MPLHSLELLHTLQITRFAGNKFSGYCIDNIPTGLLSQIETVSCHRTLHRSTSRLETCHQLLAPTHKSESICGAHAFRQNSSHVNRLVGLPTWTGNAMRFHYLDYLHSVSPMPHNLDTFIIKCDETKPEHRLITTKFCRLWDRSWDTKIHEIHNKLLSCI